MANNSFENIGKTMILIAGPTNAGKHKSIDDCIASRMKSNFISANYFLMEDPIEFYYGEVTAYRSLL